MNPSGGYQSVLRLDDVDGGAKEEEKNEKKKNQKLVANFRSQVSRDGKHGVT